MSTPISANAQAAVDELPNITSLQGLQNLVKTLSASSTSTSGAVLYSGPVNGISASKLAPSLAERLGYGVIDNTDRGQLLASEQFQQTLKGILTSQFTADGLTGDELINAVATAQPQYLSYSGGTSFWSQASRDFAASIQGDIIALTPNASSIGVFGTDELSVLLQSNTQFASINGIPRAQIISIFNEGGLSAAFTKINTEAASLIANNGIYIENGTAILTTEGATQLKLPTTGTQSFATYQSQNLSAEDPTALNAPSKATTFQDGVNQPGELSLSPATNEGEVLAEGVSTLSLGTFATGSLKVLGVGAMAYDVVTSAKLATQQAQSGDSLGAEKTMTDVAARLYFGLAAGEAGAELGSVGGPVGALIGGAAFGVGGAILGQSGVDFVINGADTLKGSTRHNLQAGLPRFSFPHRVDSRGLTPSALGS